MMKLLGNQGFLVPLVAIVFGSSISYADISPDVYVLPLKPGYGVYKVDPLRNPHDRDYDGPFELVQQLGQSWLRRHTLLPRVECVAVVGDAIVGKTDEKFFVLDVRERRPEPVLFDTEENWRATLNASGISKTPELVNPDALTAGISEQVLRPWNFENMHALLGMSDGVWSLIVQGAGLLIAFAFGYQCRDYRRIAPEAAMLFWGVVVDFVAMIMIAGGGPGAGVGLCGFPVIFLLTGMIGHSFRRTTWAPRQKRDLQST